MSLEGHPGVIVISSGSATSPSINKICNKLFKSINDEFVKNSLIKVSIDKLTKLRNGGVITEKKL